MNDQAHTYPHEIVRSSEQPKPGKKNIVICCDGTGNEFGDSNSNVVKLYTALRIDSDQVGYYHPGVGTMGDPAVRGRLSRWWSKVKGLAFAAGFEANVHDAYRYLMNVYNDGDVVYLFGFSRGAYTARALAGLLDGYGLLCRGNEGHLPYAWRMYLNQHKQRNRQTIRDDDPADFAGAFKETFSHEEFKIHFMGLWDTVSSVGWAYTPLRLFNLARNRAVVHGRHAISIDERRCFYVDNLWGAPWPGQDILQVWFAGVHSDVGGSYSQQTSGLSNIALEWMIDEARAKGLRLVEQPSNSSRVDLVLGKPSLAYPHTRPLCKKPESSTLHHSLKGPWWILELLPHLYYDKDSAQEQYRIPLGAKRKLPPEAYLHPSVIERMQNNYSPENLKDGMIASVTVVPHGSTGPLYAYSRNEKEDSAFVRWLVMIVIMTAEAVLVLLLLLLAFRMLPYPWHLLKWLWHIIPGVYGWLDHKVLQIFGPFVHKLLFPY